MSYQKKRLTEYRQASIFCINSSLTDFIVDKNDGDDGIYLSYRLNFYDANLQCFFELKKRDSNILQNSKQQNPRDCGKFRVGAHG